MPPRHQAGLERFAELYAPGIYTVEKQTILVNDNLREKIDNNNPVILTMLGYSYTVGGVIKKVSGGHVVVAYGYRSNEILCHYGYERQYDVWVMSTENSSIGYVNIIDKTEHSSHYQANNSSTHNEICRDCNEIVSVSAHSASAKYTKVNQYFHKRECYHCYYDLDGLLSHTFVPGRLGKGNVCSGCGFEVSGFIEVPFNINLLS